MKAATQPKAGEKTEPGLDGLRTSEEGRACGGEGKREEGVVRTEGGPRCWGCCCCCRSCAGRWQAGVSSLQTLVVEGL
eukprot:3293236-Rhodomonas_salina.1